VENDTETLNNDRSNKFKYRENITALYFNFLQQKVGENGFQENLLALKMTKTIP
jgi:hypothetical protein